MAEIYFSHKEKKEFIVPFYTENKNIVIEGEIFQAFCDFISIDFETLFNNSLDVIQQLIINYFFEKYEESKAYKKSADLKRDFINEPEVIYAYDRYIKIDELIEYLSDIHIFFRSSKSYFEDDSPSYNLCELTKKALLVKWYCEKMIDNPIFYNFSVLQDFLEELGCGFLSVRHVGKISENEHFSFNLFDLLYGYPNPARENLNLLPVKDYIQKFNLKNFERKASLGSDLVKYISEDSLDHAFASLLELISNNYKLKLCQNCGKFFVPANRSDTLYCNRESPQDFNKTCKEYGAYQQHQKNLKTNESAKLYRKIYMQKQMLAKRNPDITEYREGFEQYKASSKQWKSDVKKGIKTDEEYLEWLRKIRRKED